MNIFSIFSRPKLRFVYAVVAYRRIESGCLYENVRELVTTHLFNDMESAREFISRLDTSGDHLSCRYVVETLTLPA